MQGISDRKIDKLASAVGAGNKNVNDLGLYLGFKKPIINTYIAKNVNETCIIGTVDMLLDWRRDTSPNDQIKKLRDALINAKLTELAHNFFPTNGKDGNSSDQDDSSSEDEGISVTPIMLRRNDSSHAILRRYFNIRSWESYNYMRKNRFLTCRKCDRSVAKMSDVINNRLSNVSLGSRVGDILGIPCHIQLSNYNINDKVAGKYDLVTVSAATLEEYKEKTSSCFDGFQRYRSVRCTNTECKEQIGWYFLPDAGNKSPPFYSLFVQNMITDTYCDSDDEVKRIMSTFQDLKLYMG